MLAQPWFWVVLLPAMGLLPYWHVLFPQKPQAGTLRVRHVAKLTRSAPALTALAAHSAA